MKHLKQCSGWLAGLLAVSLLLPAPAAAQSYLYTNPGRVSHAEHSAFNPISPITRGATDWNIFARAPKFYYPYDEYNSGRLTGLWWAGYLEEVLRPDADLPATRQFYQLFSRAAFNGNNVELFDLAHRVRPPIRIVTRGQIVLQDNTVRTIDPTLPTEQIAEVRGVWVDGQTWTSKHWGMGNPELDRSVINHWKQDYQGKTTISAGANQDSTIFLPPGQVLKFWLGHHHLTNTARPTNFWGGSNHQNWGSDRTDYYGDYMESPSKLVSPALVPRAANLQITYVKDSRDSRLLDFDGSDMDDTGDPLLGPTLTSTNTDAETGEFTNDDIFGTSYFHYDRNGDDPSDRFSLTDLTQNAPSNFFTTRNAGTVWGSQNWGGDAGRAATYAATGFMRSKLRKYYDAAGANTEGLAWTGVSEAMVTGAPKSEESTLTSRGGEWQHIIAGPYTLAPGEVHDQIFTMAIADYPRKESQRLGQRYLKWLAQRKPGVHPKGEALGDAVVPMSDFEKFMVLEAIKDSLHKVIDQSFWAWHGQGGLLGLSLDQKLAGEGLRNYPDAPPNPDIYVAEGPGRCDIAAWYPDDSYFDDADTGVDDFAGWRIYRKAGRFDVNHPEEILSFGYVDWELVGVVDNAGARTGLGGGVGGVSGLGADHYNAELTLEDGVTRRVMQFKDFTATKGTDYFYAVTAYDNGSQNTTGLTPGAPLESSRYQSTTGIFGTGVPVSPFTPGVSSKTSAQITGKNPVAGLGATDYALSTDAGFTMTVKDKSGTVTISASATADNVTIYDLTEDVQAAVNSAVGAGLVKVTPDRPIGKVAATAAAVERLGFESVEKGPNATIRISGLNDAALQQLGLVPAEIRNKVAVVPNPWALDLDAGLFQTTDKNKILFDNLPVFCVLKIYTETGDLVETIDHTDVNDLTSQENWYQQTQSGQLVKSGIYILAVLDGKDVDPVTGEVTGNIPDQFTKFVIIR